MITHARRLTVSDTVRFIVEAHKDQKDKSGRPYFRHPIRVATRLGHDATNGEMHAALLHDVVEDTPVTIEQLRMMGYDQSVIDMVRLLTRHDQGDETYRAYIERLVASGNRSAMRVKIADIYDNTAPARVATLPDADKGLVKRLEMGLALVMAGLPTYRYAGIRKGDMPESVLGI